jgi:hypothetical protein
MILLFDNGCFNFDTISCQFCFQQTIVIHVMWIRYQGGSVPLSFYFPSIQSIDWNMAKSASTNESKQIIYPSYKEVRPAISKFDALVQNVSRLTWPIYIPIVFLW